MQLPPADRLRDDLLVEAERAAGVGTWIWELASNQVRLSANACRLFFGDPTAREVSMTSLVAHVHPDDQARFIASGAEARAGKDGDPLEFRVLWPDASHRSLASRYRLSYDEGGQLEHVVGTLVDRTEDLAREHAMQRAGMLLDLSQRIAKIGTFVWDPVTDTAEWSKEISRLVGFDEPFGATEFVSMLHPDDVAKFIAIRETVLEHRMAGPVELRFRRPDGEWRTFVYHVISTADPEISPQIGVMQDVTDRVQLEHQLRHAETMESIGMLASGVAHDFNNLMTVILGNAAELADERPDPRLGQIMAAVESGAALVQRLLSVRRRKTAHPQTIGLNATVRELSGWADRILGDDITVRLELAEEEAWVVADPADIHQVVLNLLANARDAMPEGGTVTIRTSTSTQFVQLVILDEGVGMPSDVLERALDPFFTTKAAGSGTGLGLSMVRSVVAERGGSVSLASPPEGGAAVQVELPRAEPPGDEDDVAAREERDSDATAVLLVEDDAMVRRITERMLGKAGFSVVSVTGPKEVDAQLVAHRFDVVLTDLSMPDGGGRAVADLVALRQPGLPVVFVTGCVPEEGLPGPVVLKPFDPDTLKDAVLKAARG